MVYGLKCRTPEAVQQFLRVRLRAIPQAVELRLRGGQHGEQMLRQALPSDLKPALRDTRRKTQHTQNKAMRR